MCIRDRQGEVAHLRRLLPKPNKCNCGPNNWKTDPGCQVHGREYAHQREQELAGRIAAAVLADEQSDGCDLSAGMFGRAMSDLIRELVGSPAFVPCCTATDEERASLQSGDFKPEELWGGPSPTCPKCVKGG